MVLAGELCGDCTGHLGVSVLLNRCTTCSNAKGILIALLSEQILMWLNSIHRSLDLCPFHTVVVADAVVFITLLVVMKPFPAWTYPCVFYIQVEHNVNRFQLCVNQPLHTLSSMCPGATFPYRTLSNNF